MQDGLCDKRKQPADRQQVVVDGGGAGGSRTRVQTGKPYAFYTLIPDFGFRALARPGPPTNALSPEISHVHRSLTVLFPIYLRRLTKEIRDEIP